MANNTYISKISQDEKNVYVDRADYGTGFEFGTAVPVPAWGDVTTMVAAAEKIFGLAW